MPSGLRKALPAELGAAGPTLTRYCKHGSYLFTRFVPFWLKPATQTPVLARGEEKIQGCQVWAVFDAGFIS